MTSPQLLVYCLNAVGIKVGRAPVLYVGINCKGIRVRDFHALEKKERLE